MKTIIYYRKSTDRDDKQANSLEHQLENCLRVVEKYNLDIFKKIWESKSAKDEGTRAWFNELIKICKTWKIDYIVIDEPKRLLKNNIDTSRIIDLLDKNQIKWILWSTREYRADNSRDKFLLQLYLMKNNKFENNIKQLQEDKTKIKNEDFEEKTQILFELAKSLYISYNRVNNKIKTNIMRNLLFEFFVTTKKELKIQESLIFKSSKMLNFLIGKTQRKPYIYISIRGWLHKYRKWRVWKSIFKVTKKASLYFKEEEKC